MKPLLDFGIAFLLLLHSFLTSDIPYPKAIFDLKDTIVKGFGFTAENDVKLTGFDPRDATVGHSVEYQFDLEINHKVIPFKLLEDVKHWDYMDLPIFQAEAPIGFVQKQASADGLPHDVDVGVLKKVVQWIMLMISSFRVEFDEYFEDGLISMIEVGMVSCGELRYPSCSVKHGWRYPGIGEFQDDDFKLIGRMSPAQGGYGTYMLIFQQPLDMQHLVNLFSVHCVGCFNYLIADRYLDSKRTWIGAVYPNFKEESLWDKYVTAIYWSIVTVTTTGYGDLHKRDVV
ncbi:hypothetical protein JHK85_013008 [Glycine max]|nr:hypothetical protein JHK85_013008 [Glycine max]KAG5057679.1 hypothetical protein JHK86_012675 [Glycine max]